MHFANKRTALSTAAASSPVPHLSKRISMRPHRHDRQASNADQHKASNRRCPYCERSLGGESKLAVLTTMEVVPLAVVMDAVLLSTLAVLTVMQAVPLVVLVVMEAVLWAVLPVI